MRNSQLVTVSLPREILEQVDAAAQKDRRSRSNFIRDALENSLTAAGRVAALDAVTAQGLAQYDAAHKKVRPRNPAEIVAEASTDGQRLLDAHREIAAGSGKATS
jgi:Arc/MetJ-type ribon-helix-helix transcriptional regulator